MLYALGWLESACHAVLKLQGLCLAEIDDLASAFYCDVAQGAMLEATLEGCLWSV